MQSVWNYVGAILLSLGGAASIIGVVVRFTSTQIADALQKKYQLTLDKDFEQYKAKLGAKEYVSKAYFDTEFEIYKDISRTTFDMVRDISVMIPSGYTTVPANREERLEVDKKHYEKACKSVVDAQNTLNANAPFISEELYESCMEIRSLCSLQLGEYEQRNVVTDLRPKQEKENFSRDAYKRTRTINEKYKILTKQIRDYLKTLEIY